ncbi:PEP-CTERM sorting domain-containing protein [Roseateles albus]|uniref:PEP-CTERM sorting domain-containing protein n=1 Tax=Roseateles albus TaxID=2987525 RepID=A0ABT5KED5_9BURK|nr:PEP-CTERM sorting domain-containing protein [Roseateles albus]MDC8772268.1 PEP-CTERM sorting domain-containing protein [Roseateles albus]
MKTKLIFAATLLAAVAPPASAAQFDFYKLGRGAASDFLPMPTSLPEPVNGIPCTGSDICSSKVDKGEFGGSLKYTNGGLVAIATATYNGFSASVVQDSEPGWTASKGAGLGVYHLKGANDDDNITAGEKLTITFNQVVKLTSIQLRSEGHNFTSWTTGSTFLLNDQSTALPLNTGAITFAQPMIGQVFTFAYGGAKADQFYLGAMTAEAMPVPEPTTLALLLAGLGFVGLQARRRQQA